ncbi:Cysteamine dioxygenase [Fasciola hepatica]|uniref:Cysteamine dioxygenase n=1 Tax=Fasciola hepatica TaxID=6192 RepID=A0A2H1C2B9_FASHE|nr:Cysteamine dioxygenase [Fasciola hepatica]
MTTKIATVANLALHAFQQHSVHVTLASTAALTLGTSAGSTPGSGSLSNAQTSSHSPTDGSGAVPDSPNHAPRSASCPNGLPVALQRLLISVHNLKPKDIGFDTSWVSDSQVYAAPVAYVHITENEVFSMGIFILRSGSRIPLHDHPGMYGILRVMYGSLRCRSFTPLQNLKPSHPAYPRSSLTEAFPGSGWQFRDLIVARPHQDVVLNVESCAQLLTPTEGNLHEVTPVDGPAVFLDILAPPYDHDLGTRECRFYKEVILLGNHVPTRPVDLSSLTEAGSDVKCASNHQHSDSNDVQRVNGLSDGSQLIYMVETNQPKDYWCESAEYVGPSVV